MNNLGKRICTATIFALIYGGTILFLPKIYFSGLLIATLIIILIFEWPNFFPVDSKEFWLMMPFYPILPFACLIALNQHDTLLLILLFAMVATFDTGAYIFGNLFGKRKLAPRISPGKTWEGFIGGFFSTLLMLVVINTIYFKLPIAPTFIIIFTLLVCTTTTIGDLFQSILKRQAGIKDSGNLLPGHGGFLDRFDGLLFVATLFYGLQFLV